MSKLSPLATNAAADMVCRMLDTGFLRLYDGSLMLAELRFGAPAFVAATRGEATATPITAEGNAPGTGTASTFRALGPDELVVFEGSVGTRDADLILDSVAIEKGSIVSVTNMVYTQKP